MAYHMHHLYHIERDPFSTPVDSASLFLTPSHQLALQSVVTGIEERKGLLVLYGESGLGKTTLVRSYMESVSQPALQIVYLADAALPFAEILKRVYRALAHDVQTDFTSDMLSALHPILCEEYRQNRNVVLILDNAHNLSRVTLANLGLLISLEQDHTKLIQLVLLGQPALAAELQQQILQPLRQQVAVCATLSRLTPDESLSYIQHRLGQVTLDDAPLFSAEALHHIVKRAGGIPRILNMLCVDVLNAGLARAERPISDATAKSVLADFREYAPYREQSWLLARAGDRLPWVKEVFGMAPHSLHKALQGMFRYVRDAGKVPFWHRVYASFPKAAWQGRRWLLQSTPARLPQLKTVLEHGRLFTQSVLQHSVQYLRSGLRELRLLRIDALNTHLSSRVKRRSAKAVDVVLSPVSQHSNRFLRQGVLASTVGLLLLAGLWWFSLQTTREEQPAAGGLTAQPAPSVPQLQETTSRNEHGVTPVATATEARLTVKRFREHGQHRVDDVVRGGEQVRLLQQRLRTAGFTPGPIDGILGPKTRQAIRRFQEAHGLRATGHLNAATRQALGF
jgi:type II secretory pathway predicted ATPase ExeA